MQSFLGHERIKNKSIWEESVKPFHLEQRKENFGESWKDFFYFSEP